MCCGTWQPNLEAEVLPFFLFEGVPGKDGSSTHTLTVFALGNFGKVN